MRFRGGGQIDPPQRILVFKYPSGDRVNLKIMAAMLRAMYRHNSISLVGIFILLVGIGWHLKQRYSMLGIKDFKKAFPKRENCKLSEYNP